MFRAIPMRSLPQQSGTRSRPSIPSGSAGRDFEILLVPFDAGRGVTAIDGKPIVALWFGLGACGCQGPESSKFGTRPLASGSPCTSF